MVLSKKRAKVRVFFYICKYLSHFFAFFLKRGRFGENKLAGRFKRPSRLKVFIDSGNTLPITAKRRQKDGKRTAKGRQKKPPLTRHFPAATTIQHYNNKSLQQ